MSRNKIYIIKKKTYCYHRGSSKLFFSPFLLFFISNKNLFFATKLQKTSGGKFDEVGKTQDVASRSCRYGGDVARTLRRPRAARHGGRQQADACCQVRPDRRCGLRGVCGGQPDPEAGYHYGYPEKVEKVSF